MSYASLCVLSYNRPEFLDRCLRSIHDTADYPFELIVHDDGSGDPHVNDVLNSWQFTGCLSTLITNTPGNNQGVGEAVRRMFQLASGDYLFKIDQDCTFEPGWLSEMVRIVGDHSQIGTLGGFRYWHDPVDHRKMLVAEHDDYDEVADYVSSTFAVHRDIWSDNAADWQTHSEAFAEDVMFKRWLSDLGYRHALTKRDVIHNDGFGVGPSTVVPEHGKTCAIHKHPHVFMYESQPGQGARPHDHCVSEAT